MDRKARENLSAARLLMLDENDPSPNAAVSRAYYAAYQACWVRLVEAEVPVPEVRPGIMYFRHDGFGELARSAGVLNTAQKQELDILHSTRVTADYQEEETDFGHARSCVEAATQLVNDLLGEDEFS